MPYDTREQWLENAAKCIYDDIIGTNAQMKDGETWQVSCGWPSTRSQSVKKRRIGECWQATSCADKSTHHIFISPILDSPVEVLATLAHELIHAIYPDAGHKGPFKKLAKVIGLEGKMTSTTAGEKLTERLNALIESLGTYPHRQLSGTNTRKKQSTRMVKLVAETCCEYVVRTTRKWIDEQGLPKCPHGEELEEV